MSYAMSQYETESEQELEAQFEHELESELGSHESHEMHEAESEAEFEAEFYRKMTRLASRSRRSPALRKLGLRAARSALAGVRGIVDVGMDDTDGDQDEMEGEFEGGSHELHELNPVRKVYSDAMLEHLGHAAAMAESEDEAVNRMLPLIPMVASKLGSLAVESEMHKPAARSAPAPRAVSHAVAKAVGSAVSKALGPAAGRAAAQTAGRAAANASRAVAHAGGRPPGPHGKPALVPRVHQTVMHAAPHLTRGIGHVTRTLYRNPQTRPLVHVVPAIARRTTADIARQVARGHHVTPRQAVHTLARQTAHTLGSPKRIVHAWKAGRKLDHHLHRRLVPGTTSPAHHHGHPGYWPRAGVPASTGVPRTYAQGPQYGRGSTTGYVPGLRRRPGSALHSHAGSARPRAGGGCCCGCTCPHCGR